MPMNEGGGSTGHQGGMSHAGGSFGGHSGGGNGRSGSDRVTGAAAHVQAQDIARSTEAGRRANTAGGYHGDQTLGGALKAAVVAHPVSTALGLGAIGVAGPIGLIGGAVRGVASGLGSLLSGKGLAQAAADTVSGTIRGAATGPAGLLGMAGDYVASHFTEDHRIGTANQAALGNQSIAQHNAQNSGQRNGTANETQAQKQANSVTASGAQTAQAGSFSGALQAAQAGGVNASTGSIISNTDNPQWMDLSDGLDTAVTMAPIASDFMQNFTN